jgi:hypothetical protein
MRSSFFFLVARDKRAGEATSRIFRFIRFPLTWGESGINRREARGGAQMTDGSSTLHGNPQ